MEKKDYFSGHSKIYAAFRPTYPEDLYQFMFQFLEKKEVAWDCATGNGQVAQRLAKDFKEVYATDISQQQLNEAVQSPNITYSLSPAEKCPFPDNHFDLITVAQALHWFDKEQFFKEAKRTLKPGGLIAVWGYALLSISDEIDSLFLDFYNNTVGAYWDNARRLVENEYQTIEFPFEQITTPSFNITVQWTLPQFSGYLSSWSATQKFIKANGFDPVEKFIPSIKKSWNDDQIKTVVFPVFMKLGRNPVK